MADVILSFDMEIRLSEIDSIRGINDFHDCNCACVELDSDEIRDVDFESFVDYTEVVFVISLLTVRAYVYYCTCAKLFPVSSSSILKPDLYFVFVNIQCLCQSSLVISCWILLIQMLIKTYKYVTTWFSPTNLIFIKIF